MKCNTETVTVSDVAVHAGISIKTVSCVLNHEPSVSEKMCAKAVETMQTLDYRPNPTARRLASKRADIVALIYDSPSDNYTVSIQHSALETCQTLDYSLLFMPCNYRDSGPADQITRNARQHALVGITPISPVLDVPSLTTALDETSIDYVRLAPTNHEHKRLPTNTEGRAAMRDMTLHLISLSYHHIGFVVHDPAHGATYQQVLGYRDAVVQVGIGIDERLVEQGKHSLESGVTCAERLLSYEPRPTAISAGNSDMAVGVLRAV